MKFCNDKHERVMFEQEKCPMCDAMKAMVELAEEIEWYKKELEKVKK